jgi:hypothetical protein
MTTFLTPASRAARRTFRVPVTFASCIAIGFFTERWTTGECGLVEDPVGILKEVIKEINVIDVVLDECYISLLDESLDVFHPSGGEIVDDDNLVIL